MPTSNPLRHCKSLIPPAAEGSLGAVNLTWNDLLEKLALTAVVVREIDTETIVICLQRFRCAVTKPPPVVLQLCRYRCNRCEQWKLTGSALLIGLNGLEPVSLMIRKSRLRWFGHVEWKDWVKCCMKWEVEGIKQRGCPKKTWWDCIKNDMENVWKCRPVPKGRTVQEQMEKEKSVLWHCWMGDKKGIRPVKILGVGLLVVTIWLELCTSYSSSCHHHFHHP